MGKIIRISGPVVTAGGVRGAEMHEIMRVGEEGLIGEVIELEEDEATVQVYEETSGLKPGEKVEATGEPLSVELGPGLIGTVFDGIQRPLPKIREKTGSFIGRGVETEPLSKDREWKFEPSKGKEGTEVGPGEIIGTVPETSLVDHKIMIPPDVGGKLESIVDGGEYTITNTIATVATEDGEEEISMLQEWPVRKPRPYREKLAPEIPLVSGQRVIDTFFPVAKGGTASIPGGFGTGKCVTGDTEVITAEGDLMKMEDIYEEAIQDGGTIHNDGGGMESYVKLKDPINLLSLKENRLSESQADTLYETHVSKTVNIRTRTGRTAQTTINHEFRVVKPDWTIEKTLAEEIEPGDRIVVPRKLKIPDKPGKINPMDFSRVEGLYIGEEKALEKFADILKRERDKHGSLSKLAEETGINEDSLYNYMSKRYSPPLETVKKVLQATETNETDLRIRRIKAKTNSKSIRVPEKLNEELAEFLGILLSDGYLGEHFIKFYFEDSTLLRRVENLAEELFGIDVSEYRKGKEVRLHSRALTLLISNIIDMPPGRKTHTVKVPKILIKSSEDAIASFLRGYYYGDGSAGKNVVYFSSVSEDMAKTVSHLLLRLGIFHKIKEVNESYRVIIPGKRNLAKFDDLVSPSEKERKTQDLKSEIKSAKYGRTSLDAVPLDPDIFGDLMQGLWKTCRNEKIHTHDYIEQGQIPREKFRTFLSLLPESKNANGEIYERAKKIDRMLDDFFFDEVKSVDVIEEPKRVYDFYVPETHNFVGGIMGDIVYSNTVMLHQLAKWSDTQIVVYIGCGERGNEMTDVLLHFPELEDPRTGNPLMDRTALVANTSNMPVAAREASIYTGMTVAEYFRDMGYDVALMADSTSRWAEALREISGRLEEMPSEEGYPAYLASRLAEFYERAGRVKTKGREGEKGSITVTGAVSPPGGDFSEPVTQNTLRIIKTFWALDSDLADQRHFPAINWLDSYSGYLDSIEDWWEEEVGENWREYRDRAISILQEEDELREIVQLVGPDALPDRDRAVLEAARVIREDFLQQNAMHEVDTYCSLEKQLDMFEIVLKFYDEVVGAVKEGAPVDEATRIPVRREITRMKTTPEEKFEEKAEEIKEKIDSQTKEVLEGD